jgi:hypothetical protein
MRLEIVEIATPTAARTLLHKYSLKKIPVILFDSFLPLSRGREQGAGG